MQDERYNFDLNGNRIKAEIQNKEQTYKTAEYNRLISDNESEYKYDLEGNRISKIAKDGSTIKYYWDNRNRLIKIETPNGTIEYIYDHQNRIVLRKQGETTTTFIHDGWQIVLQFDNDKLTHRYLWGTKQDELICDNDNWTLNDHLNTIRDIVKSDGTVTDHLEYNSFGKIISATKNDSSLQFTYTGKLTDKESDLQWNINRWYDAKVGRWVSEDPIGFGNGNKNFYVYNRNNVILKIDVLGLADHVFHKSGEVRQNTYTKEVTFGGQGFWNVGAISVKIDEKLDVVDNIHGGQHGFLDYKIGYTVSALKYTCTSICVRDSFFTRTFVWTPRFKIGGIVVTMIRPLPQDTNSNDYKIWQHNTTNEAANVADITVNKMVKRVQNHEKHHYETYVNAFNAMEKAVNDIEGHVYARRKDADDDCTSGKDTIKDIHDKANIHSKKYDGEWRKDTFTEQIQHPFSYP
jgi:RHS repeat-associated protein